METREAMEWLVIGTWRRGRDREHGDRDLETRKVIGRLGIVIWTREERWRDWGSGFGDAGRDGEAGDRDFKTRGEMGSLPSQGVSYLPTCQTKRNQAKPCLLAKKRHALTSRLPSQAK
jgi:hypothetical protein